MCPHKSLSVIVKWMSLKEEMQELFVYKIFINQGEPPINSPFTSKFVISCICMASTAEIFIISVQFFITYSSIVIS